MLLVCAESPKCSSRTWCVNVLRTKLFGFFVALAISVKKRIQVQLKVRSTPYLGAHLINDSTALQLKARGCATLNSTGNKLSAFAWFSILQSGRLQKHSQVLLQLLYLKAYFKPT